VGSDGLFWVGHDVTLVSIATFVMVLCSVVVFMSGLLVLLNAILISVCLKRLVIFLTLTLW
jgi:hypothetical protein